MALETTKLLTYEDYLAMPEMKQRYEVIDGELIMTPSPIPIHQWIVANLFRALDRFVHERQLGVVLFAPLDVVIHKAPLRTRQPDLLFLSAERSGIRGSAQLKELQLLHHAPDVVIEVLSANHTRRELSGKLDDYRTIGVRECWIVSPEAHTVEVMRLSPEGTEVLDIFGTGMTIRSEVLEGCTVSVEEVFA